MVETIETRNARVQLHGLGVGVMSDAVWQRGVASMPLCSCIRPPEVE